MSFIDELKRRNVFRVGIAYVVVAWLTAQVADLVLDNIAAPHWLMQAILLLLGLGLPLALFFAWAFELTPEGLKKEKDVDRTQSIARDTGRKLDRAIMVVLVLALGYFAYDKFAGADKGPAAEPAAGRSAAAVVGGGSAADTIVTSQKSIAVLPFANRSNRAEDEFFTEGIHDDLLTHLAKIGSLKVISRTSVLRYKNSEKSIPEIAAELKVATVLEGGIQRSGEQVRINVQLIDAKTDEHLWAEIFDRQLSAENLFAIQSEISTKIASALEATLSWEDPAQWARMIQADTYNACLVAGVLAGSGDESLAAKLMDQIIEYYAVLAPGMQHADTLAPTNCWALKGDYDQALAMLETQIEHGHISGWWLNYQWPWWDNVRSEPRFQAAMHAIADRVAVQRQLIAEMKLPL